MDSLGLNNGKVLPSFWKNKKVFLTGHTGFKGSWLSLWLQNMDAIVKGYSLKVNTEPSLFNEAFIYENMESEINDIRNFDKLNESINSFQPEILIHMAAQPLVRLSYEEPRNTYTTNVIGTVNVLEASRNCNSLKSIVCITTDKCYENMEWDRGYRETDPMGGYDPYSSSKGCAELIISSYRRSFFNSNDSASLASARAGNVIGGGDWAKDRLIPDIIRSFEKSKPVLVRNPLSVRPWQHVLEPLSGYLVLAQSLYSEGKKFAQSWNFGPKDSDCKSVEWILNKMVKYWEGEVNWYKDDKYNPHEAKFLKLDCSKALNELGWKPKWDLNYTLKSIIKWHSLFKNKKNVKKQCLVEILEYLK